MKKIFNDFRKLKPGKLYNVFGGQSQNESMFNHGRPVMFIGLVDAGKFSFRFIYLEFLTIDDSFESIRTTLLDELRLEKSYFKFEEIE